MSGEAPEADAARTDPAQPQAEEPVQSIEQDGAPKDNQETEGDEKSGGEANATPVTPAAQPAGASTVTDEQWRSMMDVVMAIYDFREEEFVLPLPKVPLHCLRIS